ncbi:MAG: tetratricopeptide repeat protein [Candidatus Acidiferrales bacterium]
MKRFTILVLVILVIPGSFQMGLHAQAEKTTLSQALIARDAGDASALQNAIDSARVQTAQHATSESYANLALLDAWMCEITHDHSDDKLVKQAAESGVSAAENAVRLNPDSSEAHALLGDLLGQLIPHVFGGGVRYGARSTNELNKAIELDPRNAAAYVSRATSYYFTPAMFGGDKQKAVEMLQKAIELDPASDTADTAHIWLAQIYSDEGKHEEAARESKEALRLNPRRRFAQFVAQEIASGKNLLGSN